MKISGGIKKPIVMLAISVIFLGIFIAKYANNYQEEVAIGAGIKHRGYSLTSGWETSDRQVNCLALPASDVARGYPFIRLESEQPCGTSRHNQIAVMLNTILSFTSAILVVYGLFGTIKGYRQYRVALRQHYQ